MVKARGTLARGSVLAVAALTALTVSAAPAQADGLNRTAKRCEAGSSKMIRVSWGKGASPNIYFNNHCAGKRTIVQHLQGTWNETDCNEVNGETKGSWQNKGGKIKSIEIRTSSC